MSSPVLNPLSEVKTEVATIFDLTNFHEPFAGFRLLLP